MTTPPIAGPTTDAVREVRDRGFTVLPRLLSPAQVAAAVQALDAVFDAESDIAAERDWLTGAYRVAYMLPAKHEIFTTLWDRPASVDLARATLGPDVVLAAFNGMSMLPHGTGQSLHRDHPVPTPGVTLFLNIVCALDPFTVANGATRVVPGSHRSHDPGSDAVTDEERARMEEQSITVELPAGSAVAFDATLWHAASRNTTDGERRALHMFFARPWVQPHWDFPASLPAETAARLTERQRTLLGFGNSARRYDAEARRVVRGGR